ncbi:MAG: rubrerythrin family protein [Kiritimatiellia bacterium]
MFNRRSMLKFGALASVGIAAPGMAVAIPTTATTTDKSALNKSGKSIRGTETEKCLLKAFAGESQARMRYTIYAQKAEEDGFFQIRDIFIETAEQEKAHATRLFACLETHDGLTLGDAAYPAGVIGTTRQNLLDAAAGENYEHVTMYPDFAKIADKEGFKSIAALFRMIAKVEIHHENRYKAFVAKLDKGFFSSADDETMWECIACGYTTAGAEAPKFCPVCGVPQAYFRAFINYAEEED